MKKFPAAFVLVFLLMLGWGQGAAWGQLEGSTPLSTAGTTPEAVTQFLTKLQDAVTKDRREEVAKLVTYPLNAWANGKTLKVPNRKVLLAKYEAIFTPSVQMVIASAKLETVWANWQGVMLDNGRIWFHPDGEKGPLKIVTINSPP